MWFMFALIVGYYIIELAAGAPPQDLFLRDSIVTTKAPIWTHAVISF